MQPYLAVLYFPWCNTTYHSICTYCTFLSASICVEYNSIAKAFFWSTLGLLFIYFITASLSSWLLGRIGLHIPFQSFCMSQIPMKLLGCIILCYANRPLPGRWNLFCYGLVHTMAFVITYGWRVHLNTEADNSSQFLKYFFMVWNILFSFF